MKFLLSAQLKFSDGTVEELTVPWAERYSRVTTLMAAFVIKLLEACPTTQAVCTLTRLSWSTVNAIMVSAVERGMLRRTEEEISYLGIDEKSSEKGHTYASILTDIDRSRVLDLGPERKLGAAVGLLETLTPEQRMSAKAVAMDMWPAYMSAARQCMPQADIVHDKFHISKYLGAAVDAVRKQPGRMATAMTCWRSKNLFSKGLAEARNIGSEEPLEVLVKEPVPQARAARGASTAVRRAPAPGLHRYDQRLHYKPARH